jgi:hypothetical protein
MFLKKLHTCHCEAFFAEAIPLFLGIASLRNARNDTFFSILLNTLNRESTQMCANIFIRANSRAFAVR